MKRWPPSPSGQTPSMANGTTPSCLESPQLTRLFLDDSLGINTPVIEIVLEIEFTSKWEQSLLCMFVAAAMCNEQFLRDNNPGQLNPDEVLLFSNFLLEEIRPELLEWFFSGQLIISYDGLQWSSRYEGKGTMFHLHVM